MANGVTRMTVFLIGDSIAWTGFKLKPEHEGYLWYGKPETLARGLTKGEHDRIYNAIISRNVPPAKQRELFE